MGRWDRCLCGREDEERSYTCKHCGRLLCPSCEQYRLDEWRKAPDNFPPEMLASRVVCPACADQLREVERERIRLEWERFQEEMK